MLESGQPLHAFDYDLIKGKKIIVKDSKGISSFTTIDSKERKLRDDILLICDSAGPVGLAGIMGGENSEIKDNTVNVFIESAYFDPVLTRKSSKFLGLQTDSSYRFERGVDIENTPHACNRAAQLISDLADGEIIGGLIDVYPGKAEQYSIGLRLEYLNKIIGVEFNRGQVIEILDKIEIKFAEEKDGILYFSIPLFRKEDLLREVDLIEEIARIYGYENIPDAGFDQMYYDIKEYDEKSNRFVNDLRSYFISRGFKEIISDTLVDEKHQKLFSDDYVKILNPFSNEMNVLRSNLYVGGLESVKNNFNFKAHSLKLFEVGDTMRYSESKANLIPGIEEDKRIFLIAAGEYEVESVNKITRSFDIFDLKGELQVLLEKLHIDNFKLNHYNYTELFEYSTDFAIKNKVITRIFKFSDKCLKIFDIDKDVFGCEIFVYELLKNIPDLRSYKEISKFPPVLRDLSVVVDRKIKISEIEEQIVSSSEKLLKKLRLYDVYKFEGDANKNSYTFSIEFSSSEKTLTDEEINRLQQKIIYDLKKKLNAELRT
jgi:phenylalanyl-tRNA synthetase beta chain